MFSVAKLETTAVASNANFIAVERVVFCAVVEQEIFDATVIEVVRVDVAIELELYTLPARSIVLPDVIDIGVYEIG